MSVCPLIGEQVIDVDEETGLLSISGTVDRETTDTHVLKFLATDKGDPPLSAAIIVKFTMSDMNDNPPVFDENEYKASISEKAMAGDEVTRVNASDADLGINALVIYAIDAFQLEGQIASRFFTIDVRDGSITVKNPVSFKDYSSISFKIIARDSGIPALSSSTDVIVSVNEENEPPTFIQTDYRLDIEENSALNTSVGEIKANDTGSGISSTIRYSLHRVVFGEELFSVDTDSGMITVAKVPDREQLETCVLEFKATDSGLPSLSDYVNVTFSITDVNDNAPVFSASNYSSVIEENSNSGMTVIQVNASDMDIGENGTIKYTLSKVDPTQDDYFEIDTTTGIVTTKAGIDFEQQPSVNLAIIASDNSNQPKSTQVELEIHVIDGNEPPIFSQSQYTFNVEENSKNGTNIATLNVTDVDSHLNGEVLFMYVEGR